SENARKLLKGLVPDDEYRRGMLRLIRNVIPSEPSLREVELARESKPAADAPAIRTGVILTKESRTPVSRAIEETSPSVAPDERSTEIRGVLRAVHLDSDWLIVDTPDGKQQRCSGASEAIDDVIGPMVNRRVILYCRWRSTLRGRKLLFSDIELDPGES